MSYCIELPGRPGSNVEAFRSYFRGREHYELEEFGALYENEHTGVHFVFNLTDPGEWEEDREDAELEGEPPPAETWAAFELNLFRPPGFLEEACPELRAFLDRFGTEIYDPQVGAEILKFDEKAFRASWHAANRWGVQGALESAGGAEPLHRPEAELLAHWRWNYAQPARSEALKERVFVPHIGYYVRGKRLFSASIWTDGMPIALPRTDLVILYRDELSPRRLLRRRPSVALVAWEEARMITESSMRDDGPVPYLYVEYEERPASLTDWIRELPPVPDPPPIEAVEFYSILASELLS